MVDEKKRGGFLNRLFGTDNLERDEPPDVDDALPERASDPDLPDPADNNERDDVESVREIEATVRGLVLCYAGLPETQADAAARRLAETLTAGSAAAPR